MVIIVILMINMNKKNIWLIYIYMIFNVLIVSFLLHNNKNLIMKNDISKYINTLTINEDINIHQIVNDKNYDLKKIIRINSNNDNTYSKLLLNELNFLLNRRTKVYLHLEQLFYKTNIYHIGISFHNIFNNVRYDIGLFDTAELGILNKNRKEKTIFWDYSNKSLSSIIEYESSLEYKYVLGIYDCRHYVRNLSDWTTNNPTPIWKLYKLY